MTRLLRTDFETYSAAPLRGKESVGVWNYASHSTTEILMLGFKLPGSSVVELWEPHKGPANTALLDALHDKTLQVTAFNSTFERYIFRFKMGIEIPIERFLDSQPSARYLSMPGDLDEVSEILGLPKSLAKDKRGHDLIKLFCEPHENSKKAVKAGAPAEYRNNWQTHPAEWEQLGEYCKQDIVAEEEIARRMTILEVMPLPPLEQRLWVFDQKVNDRGLPTGIEFVTKAHKMGVRSKKEALDEQNRITGLENANSRDQLLPWLKARGYEFSTLRKETVDSVLKDPESKITDEARTVLKARRAASSTTYQKFSAVMRQVSSDGRLRGQFIYMGSSRCGRWSGNRVQLQNLARPSSEFENLNNLNDARDMIYREDYEGLKARFGSPLLVIKNCVRTMFEAPEGQRLAICDLAQIETRVAGWLSGSHGLNEVFRLGRDPYLDMATKMTGIPYEKLAEDMKSKDPAVKAAVKRHRQVAKPGVLGCVYGLSGGDWGLSKPYKDPETGEKIQDKVKTGLWNYADLMGVDLTLEQSHEVVRIFRDGYPEIPKFWYDLDEAVKDVLNPKATQTVRRLGPNGCIVIDRINLEGRKPLLRMQLPSGRYLHYLDAAIEETLMPWKTESGEDVYRPTLVYGGQDQTTHQWARIKSRGAKSFENLVQAISRDILGLAMLAMEEADLPVILHAHDEAACLTANDPFAPGKHEQEEIMNRSINWAPGLLLGSEGFESPFYRKG